MSNFTNGRKRERNYLISKLPYTVNIHPLAVSTKIVKLYIFDLLVYQKNKWEIVGTAEIFFGYLQMNKSLNFVLHKIVVC